MLDLEDCHLPTKLPELRSDPDAEKAIGAFMIAWGQLEGELNLAFPVLFRLDPTLAICIYAGLATKPKLDMLQSAITMLREAMGGDLCDNATGLINQIRSLSGNARNTLAHGNPIDFGGTQPFDLVRFSTAIPEMVLYSGSPKHWARQTRAVVALTKKWRRSSAAINRALLKLKPEEFRWHCAMSMRDVRRGHQGRRSRPRR